MTQGQRWLTIFSNFGYYPKTERAWSKIFSNVGYDPRTGGLDLKANGHICRPLGRFGWKIPATEKLDFTILDKISQLFPVEMYEKEQENEKSIDIGFVKWNAIWEPWVVKIKMKRSHWQRQSQKRQSLDCNLQRAQFSSIEQDLAMKWKNCQLCEQHEMWKC